MSKIATQRNAAKKRKAAIYTVEQRTIAHKKRGWPITTSLTLNLKHYPNILSDGDVIGIIRRIYGEEVAP